MTPDTANRLIALAREISTDLASYEASFEQAADHASALEQRLASFDEHCQLLNMRRAQIRGTRLRFVSQLRPMILQRFGLVIGAGPGGALVDASESLTDLARADLETITNAIRFEQQRTVGL